MKNVTRLLLSLVFLLALAVPALSDEIEDELEKDAREAEGVPPMIPHRVDANATGEACLTCHRTGTNGAMPTPHPMRLDCVQCHAQGEIKEIKREKKVKKTRKSEKEQ